MPSLDKQLFYRRKKLISGSRQMSSQQSANNIQPDYQKIERYHTQNGLCEKQNDAAIYLIRDHFVVLLLGITSSAYIY